MRTHTTHRRLSIYLVLTAAFACASCGDPLPDVAVYAMGPAGMKLNVQRCKLADPTSCGNPPVVLLDGDHQTGQAGVYDLMSGDKFVLQFFGDSSLPVLARCRKTAVTFQGAPERIDVTLSSTDIGVTCTTANCDPVVPCQ